MKSAQQIREEATKKRAEKALEKVLYDQREKSLALKREKATSKRVGGGFTVKFKET